VYKNHLANGVKKGGVHPWRRPIAASMCWLNEKNAKIESKKSGLAQTADAAKKARLAAETKKASDMAAALSAKLAAATYVAPAPVEEAAPEAAAEGEAPAAE
jgi:small subunit ribosomal protein S16